MKISYLNRRWLTISVQTWRFSSLKLNKFEIKIILVISLGDREHDCGIENCCYPCWVVMTVQTYMGQRTGFYNLEIFVDNLKMTKEGRKTNSCNKYSKTYISLDILDLVIYLKYLKCKVFHYKTFRFYF